MDWYREKKKEKKWTKKGEGHTLGTAADGDTQGQGQGGGAVGMEAGAAPTRQRSAAEEEAARARLAAIEARTGGGAPKAKKRPGTAAAPAPAAVARAPAPVVRAANGGGGGGGGTVDLPARYIPAGAGGSAGTAGDQLPVSLSSGVQAPPAGPPPQLSAPPTGMSTDDEEQAALDAAIQLSLASASQATAPAVAPGAAPAPSVGTDAMRPFAPGSPPTVEMDALYEQLQLLLQQGAAGPVALKTLATVCGNVVKTPTESKFRSLKLTNPKIQERLVSVPGALGCLDAIGFRLDAKDGTAFAVLPMDSPADGVAQALDLAINPALDVIARQGQEGVAGKAGGTAIDRALAVYIPSETGPDPSRFDVPAEFFELSGSEAMQMVSASQAKREADSVLRTKAMRENEQRGKKRNYRRCIVRVRFPDQTVLQAVFLPREKLAKVYEVVTDALATPCAFSLFTHPLRTELADHEARLIDSDLVPASLVNFRCLVRCCPTAL
jgi:hypothetical protein